MTNTKSIYKYQLQYIAVIQTVKIPEFAKILKVDIQNDLVTFWAEVWEHNFKRDYRFQIIGTGSPVPYEFVYVGTASTHGFVWHVYRDKDDTLS